MHIPGGLVPCRITGDSEEYGEQYFETLDILSKFIENYEMDEAYEQVKTFETDIRRMIFVKRTVLVIDDDKMVLDMIQNVLADNYEVSAVNDGQKAFRVLERVHPDVILLDLKMPRNGWL